MLLSVELPGEIWVGIALVKEVLTCAPEELGPSERMVLLTIAENARDATRESWALTREELGQRAGLKPEALRKAFQRLAKAGLEVRVPLKIGKKGKPVYAFEGKQSTYRIPRLERREQVPTTEAVTDSHLSTEEAGTQSHHSREAGTGSHHSDAQTHPPSSEAGDGSGEAGTQSGLWEPEVGTDSQEAGTGSRPTPQYPSSSSPTEKNNKGGAGGKRRRKASTTDEHPRFDEWYALYPLRKERASASKAFNHAVAKVDDIEILFVGVKRYVDTDPNAQRGYIKYPATWLNKECWLDEPTPAMPPHANGQRGFAPGSGQRNMPPPEDYGKGKTRL